MEDFSRTPQDVVGQDPGLLDYWDKMPDSVKRSLLSSQATVSTLGELQLLCDQIRQQNSEPPPVF